MKEMNIVRDIMKVYGKQPVYFNEYPSMKTVKCYQAKTGDDAPLVSSIRDALDEVGFTNYSIKLTNHAVDWNKPGQSVPPDSIIVQFPKFNNNLFD